MLNKLVLFFFFSDPCVEDSVHDSPREETHISADDLPDSASQTAQQHDSKFSFRSEYQKTQFTTIQSKMSSLLQIFLAVAVNCVFVCVFQ